MDEGLPDQSEKCRAAVQTCSTDENSGPTDPGGEREHSDLTASECFKSETRRSFFQTPSEGIRFMFGDFVSLFVQMLTVDLSICVSGLDRMDSTLPEEIGSDSVHQISGDIISQWEAELLQERLQELLRAANDAAAEDGDNTKTQVRRTNSTVPVYSLDRIHSY